MKKREYSFVSSDGLSTDSKVSDLCKVSLQVMDEGVHIVDGRGRTVFYNTAMANLEGCLLYTSFLPLLSRHLLQCR